MRRKAIMTRKIIIAIWMVFVLVALIGCVSTAEFKSLDVSKSGEQQILIGKLTKPSGDGPFPAIVLLHGGGGPREYYKAWIDRLRSWGFVTLMVNSYGPRGKSNYWTGQGELITPFRRALDAHGAKLYLAGLSYVDRDRVAVLGWSHGGMSTLEAVHGSHQGGPFRAAIAFYPYCKPMSKINAPLLVLIGEKDDWTPAYRCEKFILPEENEQEIVLKVYPDAYHSFDQPFSLRTYRGHKLGRNSSAASDAYDRVRAFLEKYLIDH